MRIHPLGIIGGLAIAAIGTPALAWEPGDPFPTSQCGPQPATIGPDVTVCQAKDSNGNKHISVKWPEESSGTYVVGPCVEGVSPTKGDLSQKGARMWIKFYCNYVDW